MIARLGKIVDCTFKSKYKLKIYGSCATKLSNPFSDIDLLLTGSLIFSNDKAVRILEILQKNLKLYPFITESQLIPKTKIPLIKLRADPSIPFKTFPSVGQPTSLQIDITVDIMDQHNLENSSIRTTNYIKQCAKTFPSFVWNMRLLKY